jgi:hypothetical protein
MLAGVVLLAAFITQCRMVTDQLVRPESEVLGSANSCIRACLRAAREAREEENELHEENLKLCRGDGDDDDDDVTATNTYKREGGKGDKGDKDDRDKRDRPDQGQGDGNNRSECIRAEEARHKAALKAIEDQRRACINGCHHQGGGTGGR